MIVNAAAMFGCSHRYLVIDDAGLPLFVCECCGHRTDMLPLHLDTRRGEVIAFPGRTLRTLAPAAVASAASARHRSSTPRSSTQRRGR